jgi:hypothetical protein
VKPIDGYIYGIAHPKFPGCVKIGYTVNPARRLNTLNVGCPVKGYYFAFILASDDAVWAEQECHDLFASQRLQGEWFRADPESAEWTILRNVESVDQLPEDEEERFKSLGRSSEE